MNSQDVVHIEIDLKTSFFLCEFENRDPASRNKDETALPCYCLNDLRAHFKELMLIESQFVLNNTGYINV